MKKTLLALALTGLATSSFAYVNVFTSADGRSYVSVGADLRAIYSYEDKTTSLYNRSTAADDYKSTYGFRTRFTLNGKAWLNPTTNLGFHARVGAQWVSTHATVQNTTVSRTRVGYPYATYFTTKKSLVYTNNRGNTKLHDHSVTDPRFERLYVYFENFSFGKVTIAPGLANIANQEQGAADQNDFGTSTNYVSTPYSASSDAYLLYADWTLRYDLTSNPNVPYRFAVSTSAKRSTNTFADGNYKYDRDMQASFGWKFDRNNSVYLNVTGRRVANGSTNFTGYTNTLAFELFADVRPVPGYNNLRLRANISTSKQNRDTWTRANYSTSVGFDVAHYDTFVKGLTLYTGYIYKYSKSNYSTSTQLFRYTKDKFAYLGGEYYIYDSYQGDAFTLKYFVEGLRSNSSQSNNTGSTTTRGTLNHLQNTQVATGFRLFY
ncbi:hypothetical protein [Psittacicella gerlachiana]|uniref:Porin n=1 Tax=Psittacicella gerlachiana TaxID=2028574 RepID=A0A3A1Y7V9_9GAMM|nr:hypothetical protein [Psittacicella gerlachiana]RIY33715.1 hypothetical protein CKF59_06220 [Psittacicella gerlachiana]